MKEKILWGIAVIALVLGVWAVSSIPKTLKLPSGQFGAAATTVGNLLAEQYMPYVLYNGGYNSAKSIKTSADLTVGDSSATTVSELIKGTCALLGMDVSQTATTTSSYDCAVTGVVSGDTVVAQFASSSPTQNLPVALGAGWFITSSKASSTAGFITVRVVNLAGSALVPSANTSIGSSTAYIVLR